MRDYEARVSGQALIQAKDLLASVRKSWSMLPDEERMEAAPISARLQEAIKIIDESQTAVKAIETSLLHIKS